MDEVNILNPPLTATPKEAAAMLQISMPTMYALLHRRDDPIPSVQVGRKLLIPRAQLETWLDRQAQA